MLRRAIGPYRLPDTFFLRKNCSVGASVRSRSSSSWGPVRRKTEVQAEVHSSVCRIRLCLRITARCFVRPSMNKYEWIMSAMSIDTLIPIPRTEGGSMLQAWLQHLRLHRTRCLSASASHTEHQFIGPVKGCNSPNNLPSLPQLLHCLQSIRRPR